MTLDNLAAIGRLAPLTQNDLAIERLMRAAERNLSDAAVVGLSTDTRFDVAYKAIMQCAMAGLAACGYRTSQSQPGHHQTAIQCLSKTVGVDASTLVLLDALRKMRNLSDYSGDPVSDAALASCINAATALVGITQQWLTDRSSDAKIFKQQGASDQR